MSDAEVADNVADRSGWAARQEALKKAAERRRRLEEVFGSTPEQTSDDLDPAEGRSPGRGDTWLREQVPPHHG